MKRIVPPKTIQTISSVFKEVENVLTIVNPNKQYEIEGERSHNPDKEMDEEKAHKSQVAKITFKTAKEQLLASNPAARRTLGASRKAQAKFISPMLGAQYVTIFICLNYKHHCYLLLIYYRTLY